MKKLMSLIAQADKHWKKEDEIALFYTIKTLAYIIWKDLSEQLCTIHDIASFLNLGCGGCPDKLVARLAFSNLITYGEKGEVKPDWTNINDTES